VHLKPLVLTHDEVRAPAELEVDSASPVDADAEPIEVVEDVAPEQAEAERAETAAT
jgi:hypothetical protein